MKTQTAMSAALARAGLNTDEFRLRQACFDALARHHGNVERADATFERLIADDPALFRELRKFYLAAHTQERANELSGGGQRFRDTHVAAAPSRQPNGDAAGQMNLDDHAGDASPSPPSRAGVGQSSGVSPHQAARSEREPYTPGRSTRGLASIVAIQPTLQRGLLFTLKTSDGRAWGNIGWHELDGMDRDGAIARIVKRRFGLPVNQFVTLAEHMTETQFQEVVDEARQQNDIS